MQQSREMSEGEKVELSGDVNESLGNPEDHSDYSEDNSQDSEANDLPESVKKRLGMQQKRHKKEIRRMQQQLDEVRAGLGSRPEPQNSPNDGMNPYTSQPENGGGMNEQIYAAVSKALQMQKEQQENDRKNEQMQHVHKQVRAMHENLDNASDKYEDFDDIVRADDAPYTQTMHDTSLLISNPAETLYHLGKDREKLKKLSEKHPLDQMREMIKMSTALLSGNNKSSESKSYQPLGNIKNSPVNSKGINENTSVGELRKRMQDGGKKWG